MLLFVPILEKGSAAWELANEKNGGATQYMYDCPLIELADKQAG